MCFGKLLDIYIAKTTQWSFKQFNQKAVIQKQ